MFLVNLGKETNMPQITGVITLKSLLPGAIREDAPTQDQFLARQVKGLNDVGKKFLLLYGGHAKNCSRPGGPDCSCGWEQVYHALTGKRTN